MEQVEVVVAHSERATLRVGDVFLKIDADQTRMDVEVEAMAMVPVPTAEILWRKPPVLALRLLPGTALGRLQDPSTASSRAWAAAGEAVRSDLLAGYGTEVDRDLIRAWWSMRSLLAVRWLVGAGYGSPDSFPEVAVLKAAG